MIILLFQKKPANPYPEGTQKDNRDSCPAKNSCGETDYVLLKVWIPKCYLKYD